MVFRLGLSAKKGWRKLREFRRLADVINGVKFIDGIDKKTIEDQRSAARSCWHTQHLTITRGEIVAWLTQKGYHATGIDYSSEAIKIAKQWHQKVSGNLSYQVVDIYKRTPEGGPFDIILDRG